MLSRTDREAILQRVSRLVQKRHFNPSFAGANWATILESRKSRVLDAQSPDVFESEMHDLVTQLKTTHTGFFHKDARRIPARHAINATFHRQTVDGKDLWMFQDVHMGGPAYAAGIRPGDLLLKVADRSLEPPTELVVPMSAAVRIVVRKPDGTEILHSLQIPTPKAKEHPLSTPKAIVCSELPGKVGYLKVTMFPGTVGIDFAHQLDLAIHNLEECDRLIVDLRGNTGGGIGGLRLMSYLTPKKIEVGYSLTRARREGGYEKERLPRFRRIPSHKSSLIWLALRYAFADRSIVVVTEGLGPQKLHGRVVLLVNEHTASAGEMVSAFAEENNLATIVGTKTPGRLLSGSAYKVGHGYILGLPVAAYLTWQGRMLENNGIVPKFSIELSRDGLRDGRDTQLDTAVQVARVL